MKFSFIHAEKASFSVSAMCRLLGVTRQGYYAFLSRPLCARSQSDRGLRARLQELDVENEGRYGSPRMLRSLRNEGMRIGKRRVERAMQSLGIQARTRRRFRVTTAADPTHAHAMNILDRDFTASKPDERWVTDITYIWTDEGWCYLAAILDLFSRRVVGWALDATLSTTLPLAALDMALQRRKPAPGLLHHSDRGCQYTSTDYREALADAGAVVSMSRKGNCWDNAVAESFFATLKTELVHRRRWSSRLELRAAVFEYIEAFYNHRRLHSTLGYKTPAQVETEHPLARTA